MEEQESSNSSVMATITSRQGSPYQICHYDVEMHDEIALELSLPTSSSSSKRTTFCGGKDPISSLPDSVIQHILSYLTVEDFVKTMFLSKRWRSVWTSVPTLDFCRRHYLPVHEFATFVDKTISLYNGVKVEKFILPFGYNQSYSLKVDDWVRFAVTHHVEELGLNFGGALGTIFEENYHLPPCLYSSSSVRLLNMNFCSFQSIGHVSWTSLRVLSIGYAKLSDEIIAEMLSGSPMLEFLRLQYCSGINRIIISSSNLKELVIDGFRESSGVMEISAPTVCSISLLGQINLRKYKLIDMSSLVEAHLNFKFIDGDGLRFGLLGQHVHPLYRRHSHLLKELLAELLHVRKLTIGTWCLKMLSVRRDLRYPFSKLKSLTLDSRFSERELYAIASLLESSLELEKLTINILPDRKEGTPCYILCRDDFWKSRGGVYKCLSFHLKTVEINGFEPKFEGSKFFCSLMEFLLKNAKVLEKMDIHVKSNYFGGSWEAMGIKHKVRDFLDVNQLLLSYPRASPNCVVLLDNPFN